MPKPRLAIIGSGPEISWISCQSISQNLIHSYTMLEPSYEIRFFNLTTKTSSKVLSKLKSFAPNKIIFCDHLPHYFLILKSLSKLWPQTKPELIFHLYGDFSLYIDLWTLHQEELKKWRVLFLCASPKYEVFVSKFLRKPKRSLRQLPFPVDTGSFAYDLKDRQSLRRQFKIAANEKVWIYAGRLSLQKNIDRLIAEFARAVNGNKHQRLVLLGDVDDLGLYFLGHKAPLGYTHRLLQKALHECSTEVQKRILRISQSPLDIVKAWYSAADVFCSLSLYHDEDFGMAPAEALSSGLPVVLSDWGGYSQFREVALGSQFVPVRLVKDGYSFSSAKIQKALADIRLGDDPEKRLHAGAMFAQRYGLTATTQRLWEILETSAPKFSGFNNRALRYPEEIRSSLNYPVTPQSFYQEVYGDSLG